MIKTKSLRVNSYAIGGGAFGDEGKGKFTDTIATKLSKKNPLVVYRVNGGANAGHTLEFDGIRIALHQIPCGAFIDGATVVLGKGMVLHPEDLLEEIKLVKEASNNKVRSDIKIDSMATLALDTHRAYEYVLKKWQTGSSGATGRGIAPAYADITLRQPLRMRDLQRKDWEKFAQHYDLYSQQIAGLNEDMASIQIPTLNKGTISVGTKDQFINRLKESQSQLDPLIEDIYEFIKSTWNNKKYAYIFEMAQAVGLDPRYGVYPDVTASDTTFASITASTEGIVDFNTIKHRISTIKATYMSSVGSRKLPTLITDNLATKIREDAKEYGATTKRPRDIAFLDLPALRFYQQTGGANEIAITHMDIVYPNTPIKICTDYQIDGKSVDYRPDQEWLDQVTPIYIELPTWDQNQISLATTYAQIPSTAKKYLEFIARELKAPVTLISNGPRREQIIKI
jgi:adenylosuccinate synthase